MQKKKKILWLSNCAFSEEKISATGTWIIAMGEALIKSGEVELYNITYGNTKIIIRNDCHGINQWIIPNVKINSEGLPPKYIIDFIQVVEQEVNPDLIHIWGTEYYWGMLAAKNIILKPAILDIQGLLFAYAKVFYGGLSNSELIECIGVKELLLPKRLFYFRKQDFLKRGDREKYIINNVNFISVQSSWVKAHIKLENKNAQIFETGIILRNQFYEAEKWNPGGDETIVFTSSSGSNMYKGLHVLFRAIAVLKKTIPTIRLHIAGSILYDKVLQDGYSSFLLKEAQRLNISDSLLWLGSIKEDEIINQLQKASVFVVPSYVETYCVALAEAMMLGVPCVVSYAGAMPELAQDNESALFFPVGDYMACAWNIESIINDDSLAKYLSFKAVTNREIKNNTQNIVKKQLEIYKTVITESSCKN